MSRAIRLFPTPDEISGLKVWFDANDLSTITKDTGVSEEVSQWNSKAPVTCEVKQAISTNRPIWTPNVKNGMPGVLFDSTNSEELVTDNAVPLLVQNYLGHTTICVVKSRINPVTSNRYVFSQRRSTNNNGWCLRQDSDNSWSYRARYVHTPNPAWNLNTFTFQSTSDTGSIIRVTVDGSPTMPDGLVAGDVFHITGANNPLNNGQKRVTLVNSVEEWVEYYEPNRVDATDDETSSPATGIGYTTSNVHGAKSTGGGGNITLDTTSTRIVTSTAKSINIIPSSGLDSGITNFGIDGMGDITSVNGGGLEYLSGADPREFYLGANDAGNHGDFYLLEMLNWDRLLTDMEFGWMMNYVSTKFAIT
jgi:hypothetical protein